MGAVIPFNADQLPAHLRRAAEVATAVNDELAGGIGLGFPVISFRGKEWSINDGGVVEPLLDQDGEAVRSIEVVIVRGNPVLSKTYYANGYQPGAADAPDCWSNNGVTPSPQVAEPQSAKCAACPHNVWGSKITENGAKGKACADAKRTAVAFPDDLETVYLLRVPAASLKALATYADMLNKRRVPVHAVTTRIGFESGVAHPQLTFQPKRFLGQDEFDAVEELRDTTVVQQIIGLEETQPAAAPVAEKPLAIEGKPPVARKPAAAPAPEPETEAEPEEKPVARRTRGQRTVRQAEAEAEPEERPAPAKKAAKVSVADDDPDLDAVLNELGFDDE